MLENGYKFKLPKKVVSFVKEPVYINNSLMLKNTPKKYIQVDVNFPLFQLPDWIMWKGKAVLNLRKKMIQNIVLNVLYRAKITNAKDLDEVYGKLIYKLSKELGEDLLKKYENNKETIVFLFESNNKNGWIDVNNLMSQIDTL